MQNKGLIRVFSILLGLVCVYYLSFSIVTSNYNKRAKEYAHGDADKEYKYLDSIGNEKVWLGFTLKECRDRELGLGLDLKGGMNIVLEVSVPDILSALSDYNQSPNFTKALALATQMQKTNGNKSYLDLFVAAYKQVDQQGQLATIFSTVTLKDRISLNSTNDEVIKVLQDNINSAISNSFNVLRTRIDRFGVVQPNFQRLGNTGRILIELPGIKEPERVRKLLQGSANLEFWETYDYSEISKNIADVNAFLANNENILKYATSSDSTIVTTVANATNVNVAVKDTAKVAVAPMTKEDSLKLALENAGKAGNDSANQINQFRKNNPLFSLLNMSGGSKGPVIGRVLSRDTAEVNKIFALKQVREMLPPDLSLRWSAKPQIVQNNQELFELIAIKQPRGGRAPLTGNVITNARDDFSQGSAYANVSMAMNSEGTRIWSNLTKENIGKSIAISLDGLIYSYPVVQTQIDGGTSQITGHFTPQEAKDLANTLNSGKMPAPAKIIQEEVIGPSLGEAAVNAGMISFIIAFALVLFFMIFYYGFIPGLIADTTLFINVFFLVGILASFGTVLTLPGISGIVLTLGMAVDGNVIIYERVREEKEAGKSQLRAIADGYKAALSAIIDANVTTLLTGLILMIFGQGPVYGFAVTLVIGIVTSFITSVFLTRMFLEMYAKRESAKDLKFTTRFTEAWFKNAKYKFIESRIIAYIGSAIFILICIISLAVHGLSWSVDFTGGRNYVIKFDESVNTEEVRSLLTDAFGEGQSPLVITFGNDKQVRITTKFKSDVEGDEVENEISKILFEKLKPLLQSSENIETFRTYNVLSSQKVGPTIADDLARSSAWAVGLSILAIAIYIFIRFKNFGFSIGTLVCLAHDVIIIIGCYSLFYTIMPFSMEIDQTFVAALLTYLGYSVNDTVVILDRIREHRHLYPKRSLITVINDALNDTLSRTFSTSTAVLLVMLAMFIFGGTTVRGFIFALLIGSVLGVYSTLYVAVPVGYDVLIWQNKRKEKKELLNKK
ncbi:MAG: protein translocase subunit SecDF [Paludibacter sp.]|nr:protein translocase subunit SecDF [Paludibacter sp.]